MEGKEPESLESQGASVCHPEGSEVSEEKRPVPAASEAPASALPRGLSASSPGILFCKIHRVKQFHFWV